MSFLTFSDSVSLCRRSKLLRTPSKVVFQLKVLPFFVICVIKNLMLPAPFNTRSLCSTESFLNDTLVENINSFAMDSRRLSNHGVDMPLRDHGSMAPSLRLRESSGITRSGSTSSLYPSPAHFEHAPCGLLKENVLGSISPNDILHLAQAKFSENIFSSPFAMPISTSPFANFIACSTDSDTLLISTFFFMTSLSTIISMLCHFFLSKEMSSDRSFISPLIRARTKPLFLEVSRTSWCSPFLRLTTGAMT